MQEMQAFGSDLCQELLESRFPKDQVRKLVGFYVWENVLCLTWWQL